MSDTRSAPAELTGGARVALLIGAAVVSWFAVREAVQHEYGVSNPAFAQMFWPASGVAAATQARLQIAANDGAVDEQTNTLARTALNRDPLLAEPLMIAGLSASADGDTEKAQRLMEAARHRDPRSPIVRFWLFDHYLRSRNFVAGLDEAGPVMRLRPEATGAVLGVLTALADTPEARAPLRAKLAERPYWRTAFFNASSQNFADPLQMLSLLQELPRNPDRALATTEQRSTLLAVAGRGRYDLAYRAWLNMLPATYRARVSTVYDGNFAGWPGAVPFNWLLQDDQDGIARIVKTPDLPEASALDIRYFGSNPAVLAEQSVMAPAGTYRLQLRIRRRTEGAVGGQFVFQARCGNGSVLGTLPLDNLQTTMQTRAMAITVPAGCDVVRLRMMADPGDVFSETEAQMTGVALKRL